MKEHTKKFILGMTGCSLFLFLARAVLAGLVQATAAFFVKNRLEKSKDKKEES
jgi:hypothetical protein